MKMEENKEYISYDVVNNGSEFIEHYGIKGMKWGKHKKVPNSVIDGLGLGTRITADWESAPLKRIAKDTAAKNKGKAIRKRYETRDKAVKTAINSGLKGARKTAINKTRSEKTKQISSAALKGMGYRHPTDALNRYARTAVYKGLSKNPKVRETYKKAERKAIDRRLAKQAARTTKGRQLIAQKQMIKRIKNKKLKKAAMKRWRSQREYLYETL